MNNKIIKPDCPCKNWRCKLHGDCEACRTRHINHKRYPEPYCERKKKMG